MSRAVVFSLVDRPQDSCPTNVIEQSMWPWIAAHVERQGERYFPQCSGCLIGADWVLTARHCVCDDNNVYIQTGSEFAVGQHRLDAVQSNEIFRVEDVELHGEWDLALVKLDRGPEIRELEIVRKEQDRVFAGIHLAWGRRRILGHGTDIFGRTQKCYRTLFSVSRCDQDELFWCSRDERGLCKFDSGGPLVVWAEAEWGWRLLGIASTGDACNEPGKTGTFADVTSSAVAKWLKESGVVRCRALASG